MRPLAPWPCAALVALASACSDPAATDDGSDGPEPDPEPRPLVAADAWQPVPDARDVFVADKPGRVECPPVDGYEAIDFGGAPAFEVHTDACSYLTVEQPLLDDVAAGEHVHVRLWHWELRAPEPAVGVAAVAIEGEARWSVEVEIPADSALVSSGWQTDHALPAGTLVQFHVHNHGFNSWNLIEITAEPGP